MDMETLYCGSLNFVLICFIFISLNLQQYLKIIGMVALLEVSLQSYAFER